MLASGFVMLSSRSALLILTAVSTGLVGSIGWPTKKSPHRIIGSFRSCQSELSNEPNGSAFVVVVD